MGSGVRSLQSSGGHGLSVWPSVSKPFIPPEPRAPLALIYRQSDAEGPTQGLLPSCEHLTSGVT